MLWFFTCSTSILSSYSIPLLDPPYMFQLTLVTVVSQNVLIVHLLIISPTDLRAVNFPQTVLKFFKSPVGTKWAFESLTPYRKDKRSRLAENKFYVNIFIVANQYILHLSMTGVGQCCRRQCITIHKIMDYAFAFLIKVTDLNGLQAHNVSYLTICWRIRNEKLRQRTQCTYKFTVWRIHVTIVAMETQRCCSL